MNRFVFPNPPAVDQLAASYLFCIGPAGQSQTILTYWCDQLAIHPADRVWFEEGERLTIEMVRRFQHAMQLTPVASQRRLGLIPDAHRLTTEAANALLKILEDAPLQAIFLLSAPDETMLLPTIVSRCQRWHLRSLNQPKMAESGPTIHELRGLSYRERLSLAETWSKDPEPVRFIDHLVSDARIDLTTNRGVQLLDDLLWYRSLCVTNVSTRLLMENCLLRLGKGE